MGGDEVSTTKARDVIQVSENPPRFGIVLSAREADADMASNPLNECHWRYSIDPEYAERCELAIREYARSLVPEYVI
jgi:hypothetical protein